MSIKKNIRLFIPPLYYKLKERKRNRALKVNAPLPMRKRKGDRFIVVGNGPSLNKSLELYRDEICSTECLMVNFSASTPLYEQIKPSVYALSDEGWFNSEGISNSTIRLIECIRDKTTWPLTIVIPKKFSNWWALDELSKNSNIESVFEAGSWLKMPEDVLFEAFDKNVCHPPSYTVLTYSLYLSLYWGYKETYLIGADTSFIKDAYVDQETNQLFTIDTHFYDNSKVRPDGLCSAKYGRPFNKTMLDLAEQYHSVFYEYNLLARYAQWKGLKVYNASEFSMIDCFERKKLR